MWLNLRLIFITIFFQTHICCVVLLAIFANCHAKAIADPEPQRHSELVYSEPALKSQKPVTVGTIFDCFWKKVCFQKYNIKIGSFRNKIVESK